MTNKKTPNLDGIDPIQIARLLNQADQLSIADATKRKLSSLLLGNEENTSTQAPTSVWGPEDPSVLSKNSLRHLIESNATWDQMAGTAMVWLQESGAAPDAIAKLVELSLLHGDIETSLQVFDEMLERYKDFYFFIHEDIRKLLLLEAWRTPTINKISHVIFKLQHRNALNDLEHLVVLFGYMNAQKNNEALSYYQAFEKRIWDGVREFGDRIHVTTANLALQIAKIAFEEGGEQLGISCLQRITPRDDVYISACRLLERARQGWNNDSSNDAIRRQLAGAEWNERLQVLNNLMTRAAGGDQLVGLKQTVVEYLNNPFKWLPQNESAYRQFSVLLVRFYDLIEDFPSLIGLLSTQCVEFIKPELDNAFWYAFSQVEMGDRRNDLDYWCGVAALHLYVNNANPELESQLWIGYRSIVNHKSANKWRAFFPIWDDLYRAALQKISRYVHISEIERRVMQSQLRILAPQETMCPEYVEDYLQRVRKPQAEALNHLQIFAEKHRHVKIAHQVEIKRASISYFRNCDLARLWKLSAQVQKYDLCWRTATLLNARKSLNEQIYYTWKISGEKRATYQFNALKAKHVQACLWNYGKAEKRFLESLVLIGGEIPELIHLLEDNSRVYKVSVTAEDKLNAEARKILSKQSFYTAPKKTYSFNFEGMVYESHALPPFVRYISQNLWSYIFLQLNNSMGCYSWMWKPSYLSERLRLLMPHMNSKSVAKDSTKIARWLRGLSVGQRRAWQDFAILAGKISDERAQELIASFMARLTIMIMPNHSMALRGVQEMSNSLALYRDLENWILSPEYSEFRAEMSLESRVMVPNEMRTLDASFLEGQIEEE